MEKFQFESTKIGDDIYGLAFASLVDATKLKEGIIHAGDKNKVLHVIDYNSKEISNLFFGALTVVSFQATMIFLISNYMTDPEWGFEIIPAGSYSIVITRFIASTMMHLQVEADIKDGLHLMKWAVNNPGKFKHSKAADRSARRIFFGFFLGFC